MAFNNNNYGNFNNGNNNNGGEPKKKQNFRVGKLYGSDGILDVSVWNSDKGGVYCILNIKQAVGKDPSTGMNVYEQKMPNELPSVFMNVEAVRTVLEYLKMTPVDQLNGKYDAGQSSIEFNSQGADIKITLTGKAGTRSITLKANTIGSKNINASMLNLIDFLEIAFKYTKLAKLDTEAFGNVLATEGGSGEGSNDEAPF